MNIQINQEKFKLTIKSIANTFVDQVLQKAIIRSMEDSLNNHLCKFIIKSILQDYNEGKLVSIDEKDIAILLNPNNYKYSPIKNLGEIEGTSLSKELNKNQLTEIGKKINSDGRNIICLTPNLTNNSET